jgi:hypothetical protein
MVQPAAAWIQQGMPLILDNSVENSNWLLYGSFVDAVLAGVVPSGDCGQYDCLHVGVA